MALAHQNLAVAVGAAKEHVRTVLQQHEDRGDTRTSRSSSVYLALMVLHKRLLAADPPPVRHFIPDLEHITRACGDKLASVKPLVEAALGVARGAPEQA
jgi:hypothetical protein